MTLNELKDYVYDLVSTYFEGATVVWAEQYMASFQLPFLTLKMKNLSLPLFPIKLGDNNAPIDYYEATRVLEINLYTKGKEIKVNEKSVGTENTAAGDMLCFLLYLQSDYITEKNVNHNVNLLPSGPVQDLTALVNDTRYEYRAMQEFTLKFMLENHGFAGQITRVYPDAGNSDFQQTASGGGSVELNKKETGYFEAAEITETNTKGGIRK